MQIFELENTKLRMIYIEYNEYYYDIFARKNFELINEDKNNQYLILLSGDFPKIRILYIIKIYDNSINKYFYKYVVYSYLDKKEKLLNDYQQLYNYLILKKYEVINDMSKI